MPRVMMYHKLHPLGKVFDTERDMPDPPVPPKSDGWVDSPDKLQMTADQVVEAAVRQELAKQSSDRPLIDKEHKKKYGYEPRGVEADAKVIKALDQPMPKDEI